ncbi:hypothetical protein FACS1894195_0950 [Bacteroidia bacterium]|nr:hypothetical protein FACS1894195_0950 [Bacteroidia bacterium]
MTTVCGIFEKSVIFSERDTIGSDTGYQSCCASCFRIGYGTTEENLAMLKENNFDYISVSRSNLKCYQAITGSEII